MICNIGTTNTYTSSMVPVTFNTKFSVIPK